MKSPVFKTISGSTPILLSAPHVYPHKRPKLSRAYKIGEAHTDTIVEQVCKNIGSFGIVLTDESDYDYNYHKEENNPYKQEIRKIVEGNDIEYFIDLHGLKEHKQYDIEIYYPTKFSKSIRLARTIKEGINRFALKGANILILRFPETPQEELGEFVASRLRVPSVQIEIARYIREREDLRTALIGNLSKVLETLII
jgi:hypothetical protein